MHFLIVLLTIPVFIHAQADWQPLLQNSLDDFQQLNGDATYELKNGILTGTSKLNTPNSFLATKQNYDDFILEFEVLIDDGLNSGVQFRSLSKADYYDGAVHGYQAEIETSKRRWAGGIYDESRRGWLYPLVDNPKGQQAFKFGEWNHYRIEAIGKELRTFVNGIMCANLVDDLTATGFIAFQVHSIEDKSLADKQVHWRNVRILTKEVAAHRYVVDPAVPQISYLTNESLKHD